MVGREVRRLRELPPKRSAQWVADRTEQLGCPVPRSNIADLEIGRRKHVLLSELIALAAALDVPPLMLLYPGPSDEEIEVLPGRTVSTWSGWRWFSGEASSDESAQVLELVRQEHALTEQLNAVRHARDALIRRDRRDRSA